MKNSTILIWTLVVLGAFALIVTAKIATVSKLCPFDLIADGSSVGSKVYSWDPQYYIANSPLVAALESSEITAKAAIDSEILTSFLNALRSDILLGFGSELLPVADMAIVLPWRSGDGMGFTWVFLADRNRGVVAIYKNDEILGTVAVGKAVVSKLNEIAIRVDHK